ncbi:MAG: GNAT family N-acetyltransferase [Chloroflexota bacterium]
MNSTGRHPLRSIRVPVLAVLIAVIAAASAWFAPAASGAAAADGSGLPLTVAGQRYAVEIRPQLELISGVLLVTGLHEPWERLPRDGGSRYYNDLRAYLEPFRDHEAMALVVRLYADGMHTDRFATFAMHLGPLPGLSRDYDYSLDFFDRSDFDDLERFRVALADLAAASDFDGFLVKWQPDYERWIRDVAARFDGDRVVDWLERFFGVAHVDYRLVLAPGLPYGCGLGPWLEGPDGTVSFDIVEDRGYATADPSFGPNYDLEALAAHEWGHSFVNPVVADDYFELKAFERFYDPVESSLAEFGYDSLHAYADEQILRAVVCVAIEDLYGPERAESAIDSETEQGFQLTRALVDMFRDYRDDRSSYPKFSSYVPTMFQGVASQPDPRGVQQFAAAVLVVALLVYGLIRLANSGRKSHAAPAPLPTGAPALVATPPTRTAGTAVLIRRPAAADEETYVHLSRGLTLFEHSHWSPEHDLAAALEQRVRRATEVFRDPSDGKLILLAEADGVAVGYLLAWLMDGDGPLAGCIEELFVDEGVRGMGIGQALLAAADAWMRERGVKRVRLNVFAWNDAARRFCERAGYTARTVIYQRDI